VVNAPPQRPDERCPYLVGPPGAGSKAETGRRFPPLAEAALQVLVADTLCLGRAWTCFQFHQPGEERLVHTRGPQFLRQFFGRVQHLVFGDDQGLRRLRGVLFRGARPALGKHQVPTTAFVGTSSPSRTSRGKCVCRFQCTSIVRSRQYQLWLTNGGYLCSKK